MGCLREAILIGTIIFNLQICTSYIIVLRWYPSSQVLRQGCRWFAALRASWPGTCRRRRATWLRSVEVILKCRNFTYTPGLDLPVDHSTCESSSMTKTLDIVTRLKPTSYLQDFLGLCMARRFAICRLVVFPPFACLISMSGTQQRTDSNRGNVPHRQQHRRWAHARSWLCAQGHPRTGCTVQFILFSNANLQRTMFETNLIISLSLVRIAVKPTHVEM